MHDNRSSPLRRRHAYTRRDIAGLLPTGFASRGGEYGDAGVSSLQLQARASAIPGAARAQRCYACAPEQGPSRRPISFAHRTSRALHPRCALTRHASVHPEREARCSTWYGMLRATQSAHVCAEAKKHTGQGIIKWRKAPRTSGRTQFPSVFTHQYKLLLGLSSAKSGRTNTLHNANSVPLTGQHASGIFHISTTPLYSSPSRRKPRRNVKN